MFRSAFALMMLAGIGLPAQALETVSGPAQILDADSLRIGERVIHLDGVDAAELRQRCFRDNRPYPCGQEAKRLALSLIHI